MHTRIRGLLIAVLALLMGVIASPTWALTQNEIEKLLASDGAAFDGFGVSVAVDGDTAVIGAFVESNDNGVLSGSAYVFELPDLTIELTVALIDAVEALNFQTGITNSLDAKLSAVTAALDDLNQNNDIAAINALQAFINAVEAQIGINVTFADAEALIAAAQEIIVLISS